MAFFQIINSSLRLRYFSRETSIAFAVFMLAFLSASAVSAQDKGGQRMVPAMKFLQVHNYLGDTEVTISQAGVRIKNLSRMAFTLVATPPDWQTTIYRDEDRTCYKLSLKALEQSGLWAEVVTKMYDYKFAPNANPSPFKFKGFNALRFTSRGKLLEYIPMAGIAPLEACHVIHGTYKLPCNDGVPLRYIKKKDGRSWYTGNDETGLQNECLRTEKITKETVPLSMFKPPSGYKMVPAVQMVMTSNSNREHVPDLQDLLEMGDSKKKKSGEGGPK